MYRILFAIVFLFCTQIVFAQANDKGPKFKRLCKVPKAIPEISGIYLQGDSIWAHNDSGGEPVLFAFDTSGTLLDSVYINQTKNKDWEELAYDDQGNVFICDFGNNANQRRDLRIYTWNPQNAWTGTIFFNFEDQEKFPPAKTNRRFDAEACFWYQDSLYIFSKNRSGFETYLYTLGDKPGIFLAKVRGSIDLQDRIVTAAALSPDQQTLALLGYTLDKKAGFPKFHSTLFIIRGFTPGNFCDGEVSRISLPHRQFEALDFKDNHTIYLAAEKTPIHKAILGEVKLEP